jgi:hypothetical protein
MLAGFRVSVGSATMVPEMVPKGPFSVAYRPRVWVFIGGLGSARRGQRVAAWPAPRPTGPVCPAGSIAAGWVRWLARCSLLGALAPPQGAVLRAFRTSVGAGGAWGSRATAAGSGASIVTSSALSSPHWPDRRRYCAPRAARSCVGVISDTTTTRQRTHWPHGARCQPLGTSGRLPLRGDPETRGGEVDLSHPRDIRIRGPAIRTHPW